MLSWRVVYECTVILVFLFFCFFFFLSCIKTWSKCAQRMGSAQAITRILHFFPVVTGR
jgi:hypothetical protein